jgi:hypothetical protein
MEGLLDLGDGGHGVGAVDVDVLPELLPEGLQQEDEADLQQQGKEG